MRHSGAALRSFRDLTLLLILFGFPCVRAEAQECKRIDLAHDFGYVASAAWSPDGNSLWIADSLRGSLVEVGTDGKVRRRLARPGLGRFEFERPSQLIPTGDGGYLLKNKMSHLVWLDSEMLAKSALDFRPNARQADFDGNVYLVDQVIDNKGSLTGYGFLRTLEESTPFNGFFRMQLGLEGVTVSERIEEVSRRSNEARYSNLSLPILARAAGSVWALRLGREPGIAQLTPPYDRLSAFPTGFESMPEIPAAGPTNGAVRMALIEHSTIPTALYGQREHLYLVTRRHVAGSSQWQLHQIDPQEDRLVRSMTLPTAAAHVVLVPGALHWAVLEKAPMTPAGDQPIPSMLLLPARWITDSGMQGNVLAKSCP